MLAKILSFLLTVFLLLLFSGRAAALPQQPLDDPLIPRILSAFSDLEPDSPCAPAAAFLYLRGILVGTSSTTFSPQLPMNRAMLATALHRCAGCPAPCSQPLLADLPADAWYTQAAVWAWENGLIPGAEGQLFLPEQTLTWGECLPLLCGRAGVTQEELEASLPQDLPHSPETTLTRAGAAVLLERLWTLSGH